MLKFFARSSSDAQVATVYYTGKPRLTDAEKKAIEAHGMVDGVQKIFVHQRRPNLVEAFARTIKAFEGVAEASQSARGDSGRGGVNPVRSVEEIDRPRSARRGRASLLRRLEEDREHARDGGEGVGGGVAGASSSTGRGEGCSAASAALTSQIT